MVPLLYIFLYCINIQLEYKKNTLFLSLTLFLCDPLTALNDTQKRLLVCIISSIDPCNVSVSIVGLMSFTTTLLLSLLRLFFALQIFHLSTKLVLPTMLFFLSFLFLIQFQACSIYNEYTYIQYCISSIIYC